MKFKFLPILVAPLFLMGCKSEYEERLSIAKGLKSEMEKFSKGNELLKGAYQDDITELKKEIDYHAKVSGNEVLFMEELFQKKF